MDTLPVELLCAILAQVFEDNKRDLASCSLVSQLWRQIALPQLFETLRISYWIYDVSEEPHLVQREGKCHFFLNETNDGDLLPQTGTGVHTTYYFLLC